MKQPDEAEATASLSFDDTPLARELADLSVGDVIATDQIATGPIAVSHDGVVKFEARLGASQGRKALEIERIVPAPDESRDA